MKEVVKEVEAEPDLVQQALEQTVPEVGVWVLSVGV